MWRLFFGFSPWFVAHETVYHPSFLCCEPRQWNNKNILHIFFTQSTLRSKVRKVKTVPPQVFSPAASFFALVRVSRNRGTGMFLPAARIFLATKAQRHEGKCFAFY